MPAKGASACICILQCVPLDAASCQLCAHRKTLAEFKRTHEEAGLAQAQQMLGEEQWEAIRDVASPAAYFA